MIYESGWNKLTTNNNNNKTFKQCISVQFNRTSVNNMPFKKPFKIKQADISIISLPISPKLSKNIISKSKFYKKIQAFKLDPFFS